MYNVEHRCVFGPHITHDMAAAQILVLITFLYVIVVCARVRR